MQKVPALVDGSRLVPLSIPALYCKHKLNHTAKQETTMRFSPR